MIGKLEELYQTYKKLEEELASGLVTDRQQFTKLSKKHSELGKIVTLYMKYRDIKTRLDDSLAMQNDSDHDIREMAKIEMHDLKNQLEDITIEIEMALVPPDPNDEKDVYVEIRAGTGGDEAALFAGELFRMYSKYAESQRWIIEILNMNEISGGGLKEVIARIEGNRVYSKLKYESGIHRVQRVPATETMGRVHTSAVTVAILPEASEVDVSIDPTDLRIDVYRASGAGGQHVNKTESAVRITHIPTNTVVQCQDSRSQIKNREMAMKVLQARLYEAQTEAQNAEMSKDRKAQVGSGDRSEKIRTYNFPQNRITDHRVGLTLYKLEMIMEGDIDEMVTKVANFFQAEKLKSTKQDE